MKHWEIMGSQAQSEKSWRLNVTCHVVAQDMQRAIALVLERHPNLEIFQANHKGKVDIIQDDLSQPSPP